MFWETISLEVILKAAIKPELFYSGFIIMSICFKNLIFAIETRVIILFVLIQSLTKERVDEDKCLSQVGCNEKSLSSYTFI